MDSLPTTSISERVICAMVAELQRVSTERGFLTNAGERVFRARTSIDPTELPCIVVWDGGETADRADGTSDSMQINQAVVVEAHAAADQAETGTLVGLLKADVKRALLGWANCGGMQLACGKGKAGPLRYVGAEVETRVDGGISEVVSLTFTAIYPEGYGDPARVL